MHGVRVEAERNETTVGADTISVNSELRDAVIKACKSEMHETQLNESGEGLKAPRRADRRVHETVATEVPLADRVRLRQSNKERRQGFAQQLRADTKQ